MITPVATRRRLAAVALIIGLVAALVGPDVAAAAASDVGQNVGREIKTWASALLLGVAALVAIPILAKRDVSGGMSLVLLVVLVGGFVYAPGSVKGDWVEVHCEELPRGYGRLALQRVGHNGEGTVRIARPYLRHASALRAAETLVLARGGQLGQ